MPVFNVPTFQVVDLKPIEPKSVSTILTEVQTVEASTSGPNSFDYSADLHDLGGEIVNTAAGSDAVVRLLFSQTQPSKQTVLDSGIPLYPGGSSFTIPQGCNLPLFAAIASGSARLVCNYFSSQTP